MFQAWLTDKAGDPRFLTRYYPTRLEAIRAAFKGEPRTTKRCTSACAWMSPEQATAKEIPYTPLASDIQWHGRQEVEADNGR